MSCSTRRQRRTDEDPTSNEAVFGQILVSVCDFDIFVTALKEGAVKMKTRPVVARTGPLADYDMIVF